MVGREEQLASLNQYFESEKSSLTILYGRHQIGKTTLLRQFMEGKRAAYYEARPSVAFEQFLRLKAAWGITEADTYEELFATLVDRQKIELIVIEGFMHMVKADPAFMSAVAGLMKRESGKVMVVLTCASVSWVENSMVGVIRSDAYAINAFIKLKELSYMNTVSMFPECDARTTLCIYAVTGGVVGYLNKWNPEHSVKQNVCELLLSPQGALYHECEQFIAEEFRETGVYNTILACLAGGQNKLNEIHEYTGYGRDKISVYLKNLIEREIVEKIFSYDLSGNEHTRKGLYRIQDALIRFWFRYIYPYVGILDVTKPEVFYDRYIAPFFESCLKSAFVVVASEFLELMNSVGRLSCTVERKGSWYGKTGDIDLIFESPEREAIIGQVYVSKEGVTEEEYLDLQKRTKLAGIHATDYYLFSINGFSPELAKHQGEHLTLIGIEEL